MQKRSDHSLPVIRYLVAGCVLRSTIVTTTGRTIIDRPGGGLFYAAGGLGLWDSSIGLIGKVDSRFPQDWLDDVENLGFDVRGIIRLEDEHDQRFFSAYNPEGNVDSSAPVTIFSRLGEKMPISLLGYAFSDKEIDSRNRPEWFTLRPNEIPVDYPDATAIHFSPIDFLSHSLLPGFFRQGQIQTVTIDPSPGYMNKSFWDVIPQVIAGITAFLPSEESLYSLFEGRTKDLRVIAETLADYGCEFVVIRRGLQSIMVYEHVSRKFWEIPSYPVPVVDPTGVGDVFCGGFLAGLRNLYDPLEAALYGSVGASFKIQGSGPFFAMEALPELVKARLDILREKVKRL